MSRRVGGALRVVARIERAVRTHASITLPVLRIPSTSTTTSFMMITTVRVVAAPTQRVV